MIYGRVYCVTNTLNGKKYVGQTVRSLSHRWSQHRRKIGACPALANAINKYGAANFKIEELGGADSRDALDIAERSWIQKLNTLSPNGYNLKNGGDGSGALSEEARARASAAHKKRHQDPAYAEKHRAAMLESWRSPEAIQNHLDALRTPAYLEKKRAAIAKLMASDEYRKKLTDSNRRAQGAPEMRQRKSENGRKHYSDPENRAALSARMMRPEVRRRVAEANARPEVKARRSEAARLFWQKPGHREKVAAAIARTRAKKIAAR